MLESLAELSFRIYTSILPLAQMAFAGALLILIPMAVLPATRGQAGKNFIISSHLFGFTTWLLGATITFSTYGLFGLFIGLLFMGIGVVPMAIFAAVFSLGEPGLAIALVAMSVITLGSRIGGAALMEAAAAREAAKIA